MTVECNTRVQSSLLRRITHVLSTPVLVMAAMRKLSKCDLPFSFRFLTIHFLKKFLINRKKVRLL